MASIFNRDTWSFTRRTWANGKTPAMDANNLNITDDGIVGAYKHLVGFVAYYCKSTPPNGWLVCDGSAVSRTTYSDLYSVIGTTFGKGDGSTTFNLPDLRGEFIRGWSNNRAGIDMGRTFGSAQKGTSVALEDGKIGCEIFNSDSDGNNSAGGSSSMKYAMWSGTSTIDLHLIRPRNVALLPCIFAGNNIN